VSIKNKVAIVGAAESTEIGKVPGMSAMQLHADAAINAIADCGIDPRDIDGLACTRVEYFAPITLGSYLGLTPRWVDSTFIGGSSFMALVGHASAALATGQANVVLITHGESGRSNVVNTPYPFHEDMWEAQFERPYGTHTAHTMFPLGVLRYMKDHGLTPEQMASVAVSTRAWATRNPRAWLRDPITVEEILASPYVAYPVHKAESCVITDGGGALILTTAERARDLDLPHPPVYVVGAGQSTESPMISQMADLTTSRAFRVSGAAAFAEAGITPADVDHLMAYDPFAFVPLYALEDLGFVARGEAGKFVEAGGTAPGGTLPMNTNGGGLSYTHTGMYGMFAIQESVRQLRGTAPAQVEGVEVSVCHGVGGMYSSGATLVLSNRLP
jgi:acetyl-CoA acetyltransferase